MSDHGSSTGCREEESEQGLLGRAGVQLAIGAEKAKVVGESHISVAVPFRALERNRTVAASVLAGGVAYRLFLWLLPFGLVVGGALGLGDATSTEDAVSTGGLPEAFVNAIGDVARAAESNSWWLLITGVPLLLWEGYTGAKALQLLHALVWNEPARRTRPLASSLWFSAGICLFLAAISITWWIRDWSTAGQLAVLALMVVPLGIAWLLVSLRVPHGAATWKGLIPGALVVAVGFQVAHGTVVWLFGPKLEKSMSLYGGIGLVATVLFFMYVVGRIVVTAPILNSALYEEARRRQDDGAAGPPPEAAGAFAPEATGASERSAVAPDPEQPTSAATSRADGEPAGPPDAAGHAQDVQCSAQSSNRLCRQLEGVTP